MKPLLKSSNPTVFFSLQKTFAAVMLISTTLVACGDDGGTKGIPIDETRAATQVIPVRQGIEYQNTFIAAREELKKNLKDSTFLDRKFKLPNAESFNRDAIGLLLNVPNADGIRVYLANDANGEQKFVLVPVDKNGKDIITHLLSNKSARIPLVTPVYAQDDGQVVENGQVCPPCQIGK